MLEIRFYDKIEDSQLDFAVIIARTGEKWVFCKHKERDTYEVPGGHREAGETIEEAANRELKEETGVVDLNMEKSLHAIAEAAEKGAELVLFPEVQLTEFFPQYLGRDVSSYSVSIEDEIVKKFCDACKKHQIMAVPNLYLREANGTYDASILIDRSGEVIGIQKMVHVAQVEQFCEQDYYTPSDDGFHVFNTEFGKIGIVVCFDRHYPESIRTESLQEADLILIPTVNTKAEPSEMFEWEVRVQAFQNSVAIAMCNRVGVEEEMDFAGESMAVDANGEILARADDTEQIVYVDINLEKSGKVREKRPYTRLRRKEFYV